MAYTLENIKELRELMGAGIKDCKDALNASGGDIEKAKIYLREKGAAKAEKKSVRQAQEGAVYLHIAEDKKAAVILEVNCETDFVARSQPFNSFIADVAKTVLEHKITDLNSLHAAKMNGHETVEAGRSAAILKVGENIQIKRVKMLTATTGFFTGYQHGQSIAVAIESSQDKDSVAKNIAMHIAAINPVSISEDDIPEEVMNQERAIYLSQLKDSGKPEAILNKIIDGKLKKFAAGLCLYGQAYVKEPKQTVKDYCNSQDNLQVLQFVRYALGE